MYRGLVLRLIIKAVFGFILSFFAVTAQAACGPEKIGTARIIELDANQHRVFNGREKSLGLKDKEVILTFDDGPIAGKTNKILNILRDNCVKATFFAVGKMAKAYPDLAKRVVREGHTLAHHTFDHNRLPAYSLADAKSHVDVGIRMVEKAAYGSSNGYPRTPFFRFPYLATSKKTRKLIRDKNLIAFGTNIDSLDWKKDSSDTIVNRVMKRLKTERKGIILMHDLHNRTVLALPKLLDRLKRGGYKIVHIVPGATGLYASKNTSPSDEIIRTASLVTPKISKEQSRKTASSWTIRKTDEIAAAFIIAYDDEPMSKLYVDRSIITGTTAKAQKPVKIEDKQAIKQWALRSALSSL